MGSCITPLVELNLGFVVSVLPFSIPQVDIPPAADSSSLVVGAGGTWALQSFPGFPTFSLDFVSTYLVFPSSISRSLLLVIYCEACDKGWFCLVLFCFSVVLIQP